MGFAYFMTFCTPSEEKKSLHPYPLKFFRVCAYTPSKLSGFLLNSPQKFCKFTYDGNRQHQQTYLSHILNDANESSKKKTEKSIMIIHIIKFKDTKSISVLLSYDGMIQLVLKKMSILQTG